MKLIYKMQKSERLKTILKFLIGFFVFLYVFLIPTFGESSSLLHYSIYLALVFLFVLVVLYCAIYSDFKAGKVALFIPLFAAFAFIGTAIYSHEYKRWISLALLAISFFSFLFSFKILKNKFVIIHIISAAFFLFSIVFIIHYRSNLIHFSDFASGHFRLGDYFDNPNGVAAFEVIGFAMSLYLILFYKKKRRFFQFIPLILSVIVGTSTGSRSYFIAIGLFLVVYLFFVFKKHKWIYLLSVTAFIGALVILVQFPFMSTVKERFIVAFETLLGIGNKAETSTLTRVIWSDYGFFLGFKNGLFGYGANGFSIYSGVGTYAHNNFAEIICDFGIIGLIIFYMPLVLLLIKSITNKGVDKSLVISLFFYYAIMSLSNIFYYKKMYYLLIALMYYLVFFEAELAKNTRIIKKVIFTCDSMGSGGAERVISMLANEFHRTGINVSIIGVSDSSSHSFYKLNDGVKYISLNNGLRKRSRFLKRVWLLKKAILNEKPDVVLSFLPHVNVYTWLALFWTNIPFVVSERNDPMHNPKSLSLRLLKRMSFVGADGCVFQTDDAKDFYKDSIKAKSVVIMNPIICDPNIVHKNKNKIILSVGRLNEQKNHLLLLESFRKANEILGLKYVLAIYGSGPLKNELEERARLLGIEQYVRFLGNDNSWSIKEKDDALFVLSSDYEGMPNALIEALSFGMPCVSTDCPCGGPKQLKRIGFNLSLCETGNSDSLSNAIVETVQKYGENFDNENIETSKLYAPDRIGEMWIDYLKGI